MNREREHDNEPMVFLAPDDARTARAAGVEFARSLAGAPSAWFALALGEQELIIREGIERAGYPAREAEQAASAFDSGAKAEWQRIAGTALAEVCGTACTAA